MAEYIVDTTDGILDAKTIGELVRCRDCADCITGDIWPYECTRHLCTTWPDGFCAWGKRKEPEGPSASMANPVREARDAYMRMHGGITSSGMGKYRYVTDAEEGNGC